MKIKTGIIAIILVLGLLGVPNCIFAQSFEDSSANTVLESSIPVIAQTNGLTPAVKGSSGGKSSSSSASKTVKKLSDGDDDDADASGDGSSWWIAIIIIVIIIGIIAVWFFFLRK